VLAANGLADLVEQLLGARFRGHFLALDRRSGE
jgi:hypothetical protein